MCALFFLNLRFALLRAFFTSQHSLFHHGTGQCNLQPLDNGILVSTESILLFSYIVRFSFTPFAESYELIFDVFEVNNGQSALNK